MAALATAEHYRILRRIRLQMQRTDGDFLLFYLFGDDSQSLQWFQTQIDSSLRAHAKRLVALPQANDSELLKNLDTLLLPARGAKKFPIWVDGRRSTLGADGHSLNDTLLLRLNERRTQLKSNLRPVFLVLDAGSELHYAMLAPDLWSVRSGAFHIPTWPQPNEVVSHKAIDVGLTPSASLLKTIEAQALWWESLWQQWQAASDEKLFLPLDVGLELVQNLLRQRRLVQARHILDQIDVYFDAANQDDLQRELAWFESLQGDICLAQGDLKAARESYEKSLVIREQLVELTGGSPEALRDQSVSLDNVGNIQRSQGDLKAARESYEKSLEIREQLVELTGDAPEALRDLSVSQERLGDLNRALGDLEGARTRYEGSLEISERLVKLTGDAPEALRDLAISCECLGFLAMDKKNWTLAQQYFERELALGQQLVRLNPVYEYFKNITRVAEERLDQIKIELKIGNQK